LPAKVFAEYKELLALTDPNNNFQNYFEVMKDDDPPGVPFLCNQI
jgi:hypothetical protein